MKTRTERMDTKSRIPDALCLDDVQVEDVSFADGVFDRIWSEIQQANKVMTLSQVVGVLECAKLELLRTAWARRAREEEAQ